MGKNCILPNGAIIIFNGAPSHTQQTPLSKLWPLRHIHCLSLYPGASMLAPASSLYTHLSKLAQHWWPYSICIQNSLSMKFLSMVMPYPHSKLLPSLGTLRISTASSYASFLYRSQTSVLLSKASDVCISLLELGRMLILGNVKLLFGDHWCCRCFGLPEEVLEEWSKCIGDLLSCILEKLCSKLTVCWGWARQLCSQVVF